MFYFYTCKKKKNPKQKRKPIKQRNCDQSEWEKEWKRETRCECDLVSFAQTDLLNCF